MPGISPPPQPWASLPTWIPSPGPMGEAGGAAAQPSPPAAPAWARRLRRSRLSRRGCGSRWLSSSDTVTPAAGAHTICSHSSRSCPQTARGAALLPGVGAAAQRHSRAGTGSRAGRDGWRGGGQGVRRLDTTLGHDTGNVTGEGWASIPPMPQHPDPGVRLCRKQGDPDPCVTAASPAPRQRSAFATPHFTAAFGVAASPPSCPNPGKQQVPMSPFQPLPPTLVTPSHPQWL